MLLLFCFSEFATPTVALSKRPKPVPCPDGAYRVQGAPLVSGATTPRTDSVLLKTVSRPTIDIGCGKADTARVVAKRGFDQIKAKWKRCGDLARVRLSAKIGKPDCSRLAGVVKAKAARPRQFSAQRFSCGDGTLDAGAGETCDASAPAGDAACPGRCTDRCVCGEPATTSTTVASTTSTTSPTLCVPAVEVCDGLDNDCDGVADEGSNLCTLPNAVATCVAGGCQVASCNPSFANCNALAADGCEVNTGTNAGTCGGCGVACSDDQICASGQCALPCNGVPGEDCVTVEGEGLDEHTNDTVAEAIPIAIGGPIEGTIGNPTDGGDADLDFYEFDAVAGDLLRVAISNRAGGTFPAFGLIGIDDAKLSVLRTIRPGDTDTSIATREFVVEQSGTYRLLITDERNIGPEPDVVGGASFRYGAKISRVSRLATPLTLPVVQQPGSVPDTGDVALFSFDAVEGQELMASTRAVQLPTPSKVDTILLLFDSSTVPPTLVAKNDDQDLINMILDSLVDVSAPTSGSYLLVVDHYDVTGVLPADRQYDLTVSAPCFHCEALFHGSLGTGAACEGSGGLFEKLVDCICAGPCDAECATECSQGGQVSEVCDACIAAPNGCGPDQAPCLADTGPTTTTTPTTSTTTTTMAICGDGLLQSGETCDDTNTVNGDGCSATCLVEPGFACVGQPSSCTSLCGDGIKDGNETDVDCGGICANKCGLTKACDLNVDCVSASCQSGTCKCPPTSHTFTVGSSTADLFSIAQWPGGTQTFEAATGCSVQIANPTGGIDLLSAGSSFAVAQVEGFSTCFGTGGEDGDGCQPVSCPLLGIGSCSGARPRCSVGNNGSASAKYGVQCIP